MEYRLHYRVSEYDWSVFLNLKPFLKKNFAFTIWLDFLSRIYWILSDHDLMDSIWEKVISFWREICIQVVVTLSQLYNCNRFSIYFFLFSDPGVIPQITEGGGGQSPLSPPNPSFKQGLSSFKQGLRLLSCPSILSSVKVANSQKEISIGSHFQKKMNKITHCLSIFPK